MDAFFASVELLRYPELRGQPVVVGGRRDSAPRPGPDGRLRFARLRNYVGRGVVTTSTYEARTFGVFSAMGMMRAARLAPHAILLPPDFDAYREASRRFKAAVADIAPRIENRGIDEIYLDLSEIDEASTPLGRRLKAAVFEATGLKCSIGIAPNKLLAKIASDLDKPDGLTLLDHADLARRVWPLPARTLNGIGPRSADKLTRLGIHTVGELAAADPQWLREHFGDSYGRWLHASAHGRDDRPLVTHSEPKSISRETTFARDLHPLHDRAELSERFTALCLRLADDLERKGYRGRNVGIKLRYADFRTITRDLTLTEDIHEAAAIRHAAGLCLKRAPLDHRLRLLGVRIGALRRRDAAPDEPFQAELPLFAPPES